MKKTVLWMSILFLLLLSGCSGNKSSEEKPSSQSNVQENSPEKEQNTDSSRQEDAHSNETPMQNSQAPHSDEASTEKPLSSDHAQEESSASPQEMPIHNSESSVGAVSKPTEDSKQESPDSSWAEESSEIGHTELESSNSSAPIELPFIPVT